MSPPEPPLWIVVRHWDRYQHYADRKPVWIKTYCELLHNHDYLRLSPVRRALLHALWLEFALSDTCVRLDLKMMSRRFQLNLKMKDVEALNDAGWIEFSASKPLAPRYQDASSRSREVEKDLKQDLNPASLPVASYEGNSKKNGLQAFDNSAYTQENPRSWEPS